MKNDFKWVLFFFQMVLVAIFSETGFFDYCAVKVNDILTMLVHKSKNQYRCSRLTECSSGLKRRLGVCQMSELIKRSRELLVQTLFAAVPWLTIGVKSVI